MICWVITPRTFDFLMQIMVSFKFNARSLLLICFDLASWMCQFGQVFLSFSCGVSAVNKLYYCSVFSYRETVQIVNQFYWEMLPSNRPIQSTTLPLRACLEASVAQQFLLRANTSHYLKWETNRNYIFLSEMDILVPDFHQTYQTSPGYSPSQGHWKETLRNKIHTSGSVWTVQLLLFHFYSCSVKMWFTLWKRTFIGQVILI